MSCDKGYFLYKNSNGKIMTRKGCNVYMNQSNKTKKAKNGAICVKKEYSKQKISQKDLNILHKSAKDWLRSFKSRVKDKNTGKLKYEGLELIDICLCQGSARHFMRKGGKGINDFDLWLFFKDNDGVPDFPVRLVANEYFPDKKFGSSTDCSNKPGRRIDIIGRTIKEKSVEDWIENSKNKSPQELRKSYVISIFKPDQYKVLYEPKE